MSQPVLTVDALPRMIQVLGVKELPASAGQGGTSAGPGASASAGQGGTKKRFRLLLNDGQYSNSFVVLAEKFSHLVLKNEIIQHTVIKVTKTCVRELGDGKKVMIIEDLEVLEKGELVGKKIGNPVSTQLDGHGKVIDPVNQNYGSGVPTSGQDTPHSGGLEYLLLTPIDIAIGYCVNCSMNKWKEPEDTSILRKCEKCQVVTYCGKECQDEHWEKVHKQHCKYLAGEEKAEHSEHNAETCNYCAAEVEAGEGVSEVNNPTYFCTFAVEDCCCACPSRPPENSPFPLTGVPGDRCERMINATQRLLLKMKLTNHPVEQKWPEELERINDVMIHIKRLLFILRITLPHRDYLTIPPHNNVWLQ